MLREYIGRAGKKLGIPLMKSGTYVCVNGPRFETKAEIRMFLKNGIDIVGMTAMPEASLAREVELCYAGITIITNYAAGLKERRLTATEVMEMMKRASSQVGSLLRKVISIIPVERKCTCKEALKEARW
ncbi:MAG: hypothetical protein FJ243_02300 [Nitrospira sp.]|nr:hypothetical protein [Nitrospira sp.]